MADLNKILVELSKLTVVEAAALSKQLEAKLILEKFEENPFLKDFYKNQDRYAFQTQLFFLLSRFKQQSEFKQIDINLSEYSTNTILTPKVQETSSLYLLVLFFVDIVIVSSAGLEPHLRTSNSHLFSSSILQVFNNIICNFFKNFINP